MKTLAAALLLAASSIAAPVTVIMKTTAGDLEIEVDVERAPKSAGSFLWFVDHTMYDRGAGFYRTVSPANDHGDPKISVIQGGLLDDEAKVPPRVAHETTESTGLKHTDGTISLARGAVGTAGGEAFFICIGDQPGLDFGAKRNPDAQGFAAFGHVTKGLDIVKAIHDAETDDTKGNAYMKGQLLKNPVRILKAYRKKPTLKPR